MAADIETTTDRPALTAGGRRNAVRLVLRALTLLVFLGAAIVLFSLVMDSGVIGGKSTGRILFTDIPETYPHRNQIEQVARLGILPGVTDKVFAPRGPVSRALLAEAIVHTMDWPVSAGMKQPYKDVEGVSSKIDSADYIAVATAQGVLGRVSVEDPPLFKPDEAATIVQTMVALVRAGGAQLTAAQKTDAVVAKLPVSDQVKMALSTAKANGLLADSGIDLAKTDLTKPVTREQLAVLISNFRTVVAPASSG